MTKNRSLTILVVVVAAAVVLTGGLMASNMGFKLNRQLVKGDVGVPTVSKSGTQFLALPYNRQVGIDTASQLFKNIGGANVATISKYLTATDTYQLYTFGEDDFALEEGVGLQVKMSANSNYIIVGSHNPGATVQLEAGGAASKSGTNLYAPPYHGTASTASALFKELGGTSVATISSYLTLSDTFGLYTYGEDDYPLNPGEAYSLKMSQTKGYTPSHY